MIEKDNIQELFSKAFENQTAAVRPELWAGVQAKMAAAGVASTAAVASKGLSALTKWIIGSAAVGTVGVVTTVIAWNAGEETSVNKADSSKGVPRSTVVSTPGENTAVEKETVTAGTVYTKPNALPDAFYEENHHEATPSAGEVIQEDPVVKEYRAGDPVKALDEKIVPASGNAPVQTQKDPADKKVIERQQHIPAKPAEEIKEPVFVKLEAKVTKFPNVFTPNGDRQNDIYFVEAENIVDFQLVIIDQSNREMFRSTTPGEQEGWNGRDKSGDEAPNGSYAAIVTGKDQNGKSFKDIQLFELRR